MKQAARESLDAYYREAGSWAEDREDALRASRRLAWIVATVALVVALCEALALIFLAPLKTVVPYTLLVDKQTGYVQELKPLDAQKIAPDTALTQSFLVQYVIARESYDRAQLQASYAKVQAWSVDTAKSDYVSGVVASNPESPLQRLPASTIVETRVKSVSSLGGNSALVRFETIRRDAGGAPQPAASWVAVIRYRFTTEPMRAEDRFINPLGFQVTRYRRDQEAVTPPEPAPTATFAPTEPKISAPELNARPAPTRRPASPDVEL
ncbi:VirB8/TrbF family protein [Sphingomonas bacterium]|uniref:virB8 family protein n=1 Tax=Sphingomonas bacterium TaxID=1895847 RepID=UPI002628B371|nr:VirB8/TrbF family protein [Sphingomonas bacterium]MDB5678261.1 hypothetical protein [Sphingomonas bacterium]